MFIYIIQTIFLLLIAFALGALVGYLLKKYFGCPEQSDAQTDLGAGGSMDATSSSSTLAASQASVSEAATDTPVSGLTASSDESSNTKGSSGSESNTTAATAKKTSAAKKTSTAKTPASKTSKPASAKKAAAPAKKSTAASKPVPSKAKPAAKKPAAVALGSDDLKLIKGVGKLNEIRLNDEGITTFAQVAAWKKADIADFDEKLNFKGRIEREEWVPQAKVLAKDGAKKKPASAAATGARKAAIAKVAPKATKAPVTKTTAAKAPAKKQVTKKPAVKKAAPKKAAPKAAPAKPDDLKLIKGVGKLIETKLAKEGITQYSQIAAWKKADITDFDEKLSFKGRIERDDWIAQAKILAKGGTTDFSKRAAKGDVPSSASGKK